MLAIAILAAGKGTRMQSALPKVLQSLGGKTLIERVLASCECLKANRTLVIVGHQSEKVQRELAHIPELEFILQSPQNGTGHAIQQLVPVLKDFSGDLLVLNGDVPLLRAKTIEELIKKHRESKSSVTFLSADISNPQGYGRVFSDNNGLVERIVEDKDCTNEERKNTITNSGIYCFKWRDLQTVLPTLTTDNEQGEIYLTDTIAKLSKAVNLLVDDFKEVTGVNNREQMSRCEGILQERLRKEYMNKGVSFIDPNSCTMSDDCTFGKDVIIHPQTHLRGVCNIGDECQLGPGSLIENSSIGNNVDVLHSVLNNCHIENHVKIGPFAHIRPDAKVYSQCKIGNFVEIKKSEIGEGTKVNHLSYIGDSSIGKNVNVGAGTITANYDGENKHRTIIGSNTKTGANSVVVAPITIGTNVTIGAGSTITKDVIDNSLAIARAKQFTKSNWQPAKNKLK